MVHDFNLNSSRVFAGGSLRFRQAQYTQQIPKESSKVSEGNKEKPKIGEGVIKPGTMIQLVTEPASLSYMVLTKVKSRRTAFKYLAFHLRKADEARHFSRVAFNGSL